MATLCNAAYDQMMNEEYKYTELGMTPEEKPATLPGLKTNGKLVILSLFSKIFFFLKRQTIDYMGRGCRELVRRKQGKHQNNGERRFVSYPSKRG